MRGGLQVGASYALLSLLVAGFVQEVVRQDPFWALVALMGIAIALLPAVLSREPRNVLPWWFVLLIALPSIGSLLSNLLSDHYVRLTDAAFWIADIIGVFMISLAVMLVIRGYSSVRMNRPFLVGSTFMVFEVFLGAYGVIDYQFDQLLGTHNITSNSAFMVYVTISTIGAVVLALMLNYYIRLSDLDSFQRDAVGRGVGD